MTPSKQSAHARGYRQLTVKSEDVRTKLEAAGQAEKFTTTSDYLVWLSDEVMALAAEKGFATRKEWVDHIKAQRAKKAQT